MKVKDELDEFNDYLLERDHISLILKLHLNIEQYMDLIIEKVFPSPEKIFSFRFIDKVYILNSIGLIPDDIQGHLLNFNQIRNKFSHKFKYTLSLDDLNILKQIFNNEMPHIPDSIKDNPSLANMPIISKAAGFLTGNLAMLSEVVKKIEYKQLISNEKLEGITKEQDEWESEMKKKKSRKI